MTDPKDPKPGKGKAGAVPGAPTGGSTSEDSPTDPTQRTLEERPTDPTERTLEEGRAPFEEPDRPHRFLRSLNGLAVLAQALVVGGIGAELLAQGHLATALALQVPLYGLAIYAWGLFVGARWVPRVYLPAIGGGGLLTVVLYVWRHGDHFAAQWEVYAGMLKQGPGFGWVFGLPALVYLVILFVLGPGMTAWLWLSEGGEGQVGGFLIRTAEEDGSDTKSRTDSL